MKPRSPVDGNSGELLDVPEFDFTTPAYSEFSAHMDAQLTELVALWQHLAAPCALRTGRTTLPRRSRCES